MGLKENEELKVSKKEDQLK
uniref:Uncharacterized protein n=1 Tax=Heterorhabditis bacteriophora TaxID=37862 RepID=A0A1I7WAF0_HETBA